MRLRRSRWRLEAAALRAALAVCRGLGPVAASDLGGRIVCRIGPLLPVSRVAEANLRLALPALRAGERAEILRSVWENLGRTAAELPHLGALGPSDAGAGWEIEGEEHLRPLARGGGPAVLVSGHLANWEVLPAALLRLGIPMASIFRAPDNPAVDAMLRDARRAATGGRELPLFPKGAAGARLALRHLAEGGVLGLLADQKMNDGIAVPFFGHLAMTAAAPAALALRFRCPLIPGHVERLGPARFRLVAEAPLPLPDSGDRGADLRDLTLSINARLEAWIRARPGEWLWLHRRWPAAAWRQG